jgi:DnaJ-class molecular chaperone
MKTKYFEGCTSLDEIKSRYKELALKQHPDRGGDTKIMKVINLEYESIKQGECIQCKMY